MRTAEQQQALEAAAQFYKSLPDDRRGEMNLYMTKTFGVMAMDDLEASIASVKSFIEEQGAATAGTLDAVLVAEPSRELQREAVSFFESIALPLLERGWQVAPCYPKQKQVHTALVPRPLEMQSSDPAQIHAWGIAEPNANVCVYAEQVEGGLCFLDKDGSISLIEKYERETGKTFPRTLLVCSSVVEDPKGGTYSKGHWYFLQTARTMALPGNIPESKTGGLFSLRVHNQYVASIGSIHPVTGKPYFIYDDAPVIPMPDEFLDWLLKQVVEEKSKPATATAERRQIPHGQLHGAYMAEAGRLWNAGYHAEDVVEMTVRWVHANGQPPIDEAKVRKEALDLTRRYKQGEWTGLDFNQKPEVQQQPPATGGNLQVKRMSAFEKKKINWLWQGRIPSGTICTLAGDPDVGKSLVTLYVAACVTHGLPFYGDDKPTVQGEVLILSAEDDPENTLAPRLEAAGADLDRVHLLQSVMVTDGAGKTISEREAQLDTDINAITKILDNNPLIRVVIIDPLSSFLGDSVSMVKEQEMRKVLSPLVRRARASNIVVINVVHFNKNSDTKSAMDRVGGAKALVGLGRSAWTCVREPKSDEPLPEGAVDPGERFLFLKLKGNLAPSRIGGLVYTIRTRDVVVKNDETGSLEKEAVPYTFFFEDTTSTAQEVVIDGKRSAGRPNKVTTCEAWMKSYLATTSGCDMASRILLRGNDEGFSDRTIYRTRELVGLGQRWIGRVKYWGYPANLPTADPEPNETGEHGGPRPGSGRKRSTVNLESGTPQTR